MSDEQDPNSSYQDGNVALKAGHPFETPRPPNSAEAGADALIDMYYSKFNGGHPFLVPRKLLRMKPTLYPPYLKTTMQFVASHFLLGHTQGSLRIAAESILSAQIAENGHKVQGLMLFGMSLFARFEQDSALTVFNRAIDLALSLGMNSKNFALNHGVGNPIIEESWRRTWWELYMVDGILASLNSVQHVFRLQNIQTDVPLPGEEINYAQCQPTHTLRSQSDFLDRSFAMESYPYSSMAYKIEAVRLMGKVVRVGFATSDEQVEGLDTNLASFALSLPPNKRHIVERGGTVDEVLFSTHNIIDCALIMLHRPRSSLPFIRNHYPTQHTT